MFNIGYEDLEESYFTDNSRQSDFKASLPEQSLFNWGLSMLTSPVTGLIKTIRECSQSLLKDMIFPAASDKFKAKLDPARLDDSRDLLKSLGGVNYTIETVDGAKVDAMYITAKKFRGAIESLGGQFKTKIDAKGKRVS